MATLRLIRIPARLRTPDLKRRLPRHPLFRDRTGEKLNGSVVVGYAGVIGHSSAWLCRCPCGKLYIKSSLQFSRATGRCGCGSRTHGLTYHPLYPLWRDIVGRCHNPNHESYSANGANGVRVCRRWRESVTRFVQDVGEPPGPNYHLIRINAKENFTPTNCRWAPNDSVGRGGKPTLRIAYQGKTMGLREWAEKLGMSTQGLERRVKVCRKLGADLSEAVATPSGVKMPCMRMKR